MITEKRKYGDTGEDVATDYLLRKGYRLLEAAKVYRQQHPDTYKLNVRIDAVCIVGAHCGSIEHLIDPFRRRIQDKAPWRTHYRRQRGTHAGFYHSGW